MDSPLALSLSLSRQLFWPGLSCSREETQREQELSLAQASPPVPCSPLSPPRPQQQRGRGSAALPPAPRPCARAEPQGHHQHGWELQGLQAGGGNTRVPRKSQSETFIWETFRLLKVFLPWMKFLEFPSHCSTHSISSSLITA